MTDLSAFRPRCRVKRAAKPGGDPAHVLEECGRDAIESGPQGDYCAEHAGSFGTSPATYPRPPGSLPLTLHEKLRADREADRLRIVALERRVAALEGLERRLDIAEGCLGIRRPPEARSG